MSGQNDQENGGWYWSHGIIVFNNEWTWLPILLLMAIPCVLLLALMEKAAMFFADHIVLIGAVYFLLPLALGCVIYLPSGARYRKTGIFSAVLTTAPTFLALALYLVPFEALDPGFDAVFDFFLIMLIFVGGACLITALACVFRNGLAHFAMAGICFIVFMLILRWAMSTESDLITPYSIKELYGF